MLIDTDVAANVLCLRERKKRLLRYISASGLLYPEALPLKINC